MPIEIRELVIRAVVEPSQSEDARDPAKPALPRREPESGALVQACVDEVLRILRRERER